MSYQVHITSTAEHDIMRAADYIEFTLKNPDAADNLLDAAFFPVIPQSGTYRSGYKVSFAIPASASRTIESGMDFEP